MRSPSSEVVAGLAALVGAGGVVVLSGAGISTDSGIPDYRGADGPPRRAPMTYQEFVAYPAQRQRYWARSHVGWQAVATARPNPSHLAVTTLQRAGLLAGVVTQNVDGLHTAAGTHGVVDLHGRLDAVVCLTCGHRRPRAEMALRLEALNPQFRERMAASATVRPDGDVVVPAAAVAEFHPPACRRCGGVLKPDVVFFGEAVPRARMRLALGRLNAAKALLVLGSSLTVGSGYRFVTAAVQRQLPVAIINRGHTRGDRHATLKLDAGLADVLPGVAGTALSAMQLASAGGPTETRR